ncbi:NADH dehydrogenase [ubiquinone] 1 beta subcomplex subunit 11, mitochondrial [Hetaerina americana]|uniref:NADH dehydrogenase [ubiquinone] 1 beta subcomplex subunit 11, mitochondrial n=1 Tax=Hetaerina americana TaxID=62018 RepID=UPI003A7F228D
MSLLNGVRCLLWGRNVASFSAKRFNFGKGNCCRFVSTGEKSSDTATLKEDVIPTQVTTSTKNWISYGYDTKDEENDKNAAHATMFFSVTLCIVIGGFFFTYLPDQQLKDWSQREAYLQLRHREQNGLPFIDANYVDPSTIELPSDEELGETEIII